MQLLRDISTCGATAGVFAQPRPDSDIGGQFGCAARHSNSVVGCVRQPEGEHMRRRAFISLLGGAAVAWPLAARAQHLGKVWRIGFVTVVSAQAFSSLYAGFLQGMRELGHVEGRDFVTEPRSAEGEPSRLPHLAAELVRLTVDVIVTGSTAAMRPLKQATTTIPILMPYSTNPVGNGLISSLAR